jgi:hypothetical protein
MTKKLETKTEPSTIYQVRIKGHLDDAWSDWFEGMTITPEEKGETLLTGPMVDQAALYGILKKVRDLGLTLISVYPMESLSTAEWDRE